MPLVAVGMPTALAKAVQMKADTMPTPMVTSMPIDCLPGNANRPRTPTTMPIKIAVKIPVMVMLSSKGAAVGAEIPSPARK